MVDATAGGAPPLGWLGSPHHREWLRAEERRLLRFPATVVGDRGDAAVFAADGSPVPDAVSPTFGTARLAHVHALAALRGEPGARPTAFALLDHLDTFSPRGWPENPRSDPDEPQSLYTLAFVVLAASSGVAVGHPRSPALLHSALDRLDTAFWEPRYGRGLDRIDRDGRASPYRGLNANMHLTEALFAAGHVLDDERLRSRAVALCGFAIEVARERGGRICEHFDSAWTARPEHHRDRPDDRFLPYGATVGHGMEWSRLIAQCASVAPAGYLDAAVGIFDRAAADGWAVDGRDGFVYTTDWSGRPVVHRRLHWVAAEAVAAAAVLFALTGEGRFAARYEQWLDHVAVHLVDRDRGSWHHELDRHNRVPAGAAHKPDLYHAYQAVLVPQLPVCTSLVEAVTRPAG